ncbi:uncharacterized protein EV422DRAFT_56098 [Fimicolochytrium jonesii]|uniref:uncharacterized protein n=1 Tax=Fimicolochytrium jonesii TaxID=1396493 RepID=UPI0022FE5B04|nr:uncharacterized protein EV422DRAFT_56098 [Fimicolochytrium jonesii]KAI8821155.1 hypothetical protein EV422DRAFT_56098 [Fimicolochytrium jonesii]
MLYAIGTTALILAVASAGAGYAQTTGTDGTATDPVQIGGWKTWTDNAGVVAIHAAYSPGDKLYISERVHYWNPPPATDGWTQDQITALSKMPLMQWYNGNPNFANKDFFTDAAEFNFGTKNYTFINQNFFNNSVQGQLHGYAFCSGHAQLANGSYFVAGGDEFWDRSFNGRNYTSNGRSDIRVMNPSTETTPPTLQFVASMYRGPDVLPSTPGGSTYKYWGRWYPSAVLLPTEDVMLVGGQHYFFDPANPLADNPTYEMWSPTQGPYGTSKNIALLAKHFPINMYPLLYVLPSSGNVWVFAHSESAIIDPKTGAETAHAAIDLTKANGTLPLSFPFAGTNFVPMLSYRDNYHMESWICGGVNGTAPDGTPQPREGGGDPTKAPWSNCPTCLPVAACHWTTLERNGATVTEPFQVEQMPLARSQPGAVNLPDGTVVIVSGSGQGHQGGVYGQPKASKGVKQAVIFDPSYPVGNPKRWKVGAPAPTARHYHNTALLREDGTVLTGGGDAQNGDDFVNGRPDEMGIDVYYPPYKYIANPPQLVLPFKTPAVTYGQQIVVQFTSAVAPTIQQVSIIRYASMTHTVNNDQRHIELQILKYAADKVLVQLPANGNIAPPGNWMLFAMDNRGAVVAQAATINLRTANTNTPATWNEAETVPTPTFKSKVDQSSEGETVGPRKAVLAVAGIAAIVAGLSG